MTPTLDQIRARAEDGLVSLRRTGPLVIANYTDVCTYAKAWDAVTLQCRGLIFEESSGQVVGRGFDKFFNSHEPHAFQPPAGEAPIVTIKHDGSLGIGFEYGGEVRWSTRGSLESPQSAEAARIWHKRHADVPIPDGCSVLTEIISPRTRNVMRYEWEGLIVLAIRHTDGTELEWESVEDWCNWAGMRHTERISGDLDELVERAAGMDATEEGFVLRWGSDRVKVKSSGYVAVARFLQGLSPRRVADCWYAGRRDLVEHYAIADDLQTEIARQWAKLDGSVVAVKRELISLADGVAGMDRKSVALKHRKSPLFPLLMRQVFGGHVDARLHVYMAEFGHRPRSV